jgi:hypothetical protein
MRQALRIGMQLLLYVPLMLLIAVFSAKPQFRQLGDDQALLRLSFVHAAQRKEACRERSPAELAKLAPNMRAALDCPRERASVLVELEVDGNVVLRRDLPPSGLKHDGNAAVYHRMPLPAGKHRIVARLRDRAEGDFNYVREATLELAPGSALVIDFVAAQGGFVFRT